MGTRGELNNGAEIAIAQRMMAAWRAHPQRTLGELVAEENRRPKMYGPQLVLHGDASVTYDELMRDDAR